MSDLNGVSIDEERGAALAVRHLLDLGHRRIGLLDSDRRTGNSEKIDGYRKSMAAAGLPVDDDLIVGPGGHSIAHGYQAIGQLLQMRDPPTAVLASTDRIAMGGLRWCYENGLRVPDQISIIGYDNVDYAAAASTPLSSVNYPTEDVARQAASLILGLVEGPERQEATRIVIEPNVFLRKSTGPAIEAAHCDPEGYPSTCAPGKPDRCPAQGCVRGSTSTTIGGPMPPSTDSRRT